MKRIIIFALCLVSVGAKAQWLSVVGSKQGTCPNSWTVLDWSGGTNGAAPTTGTLGSSTFGMPSGGSFTITDPNSTLTYATAANHSPFLTTPPCIGFTWPNTSTLGLQQANGVGGNSIVLNFTSPASAVVACIPMYTTIPQNAPSFGRVDTFYLSGPFVGLQFTGDGTLIEQTGEMGGSPVTYPGGEFFGPAWPTSTWQTTCNMLTTNGGGSTQSQATWDASGNYIAGSGFTTTNTTAYGAYQILIEGQVNTGPSGSVNNFGTMVACGLSTASTNCAFQPPGYQLVTPLDSPGPGTYTSTQSVTLSSPSAVAPVPASIHYSLSGTATCGSTVYSGAFNISSTATLSSVACLSGFPTSPTLSSIYSFLTLPYSDSFAGTSPLSTPWVDGFGGCSANFGTAIAPSAACEAWVGVFTYPSTIYIQAAIHFSGLTGPCVLNPSSGNGYCYLPHFSGNIYRIVSGGGAYVDMSCGISASGDVVKFQVTPGVAGSTPNSYVVTDVTTSTTLCSGVGGFNNVDSNLNPGMIIAPSDSIGPVIVD